MNQEFRRSRRRKVVDAITVTDTMTAQPIGQVSNLSETGMMMIANVPMVEDGLYQFSFALQVGAGSPVAVEVGAHLLWLDQASTPGQSWVGLRFIGLDEGQLARMREWIDTPGAQYV